VAGRSATTAPPTDVATSSSAFNQLESWRGIATRYDEHATVFHGAVVLASILI
jgi:hypothetical protein